MKYVILAVLGLWGAIASGADLAVRTPFEQLFVAIEKENLNAIHDLLEQHNDLIDQIQNSDRRPFYRYSALHLAAEKGYLPAVKKLVAKIKERWLQSRLINRLASQQTPLDLAIAHGHLDVATYLVQTGGAECREEHLAQAVRLKNLDVTRWLVNRLHSEGTLAALDAASQSQTSPEILFFLGQRLKRKYL
ncbi:MAG TPA: ankyrin repeat domain-containing protein, partial [Myxococcota bacterium]|nr:ankyrin repeat domain-containing protein [Myxococcota bacterium]